MEAFFTFVESFTITTESETDKFLEHFHSVVEFLSGT
uniref:Uncharacterized protein n=1 Tax=Rhizophora mucronata TaxID=61149 RepID=A0A2P2PWH4_RHIMU